jgi:hypothetical protein
MSEREERIGLNEAVFREVNERISDLADDYGLASEPLDLVCECGDPACVERITMTQTEYERMRADPTHFAVFPGHEKSDVDEVIDRRETYDLVRKREGAPADVAKQTDPRS